MTSEVEVASVDFVTTKEHLRFEEFCEACRKYRYIGLCYGTPGVGKTLSARHYAHWEVIEPLLPRFLSAPHPISGATEYHSVLYTPPVVNNAGTVGNGVAQLRVALRYLVADARRVQQGKEGAVLDPPDCTDLILVDEADRLGMHGLEQLRAIYDQDKLGLILIGMPGIEKRLARFPQFYSRIGFAHHFRSLQAEETREIVVQKSAIFKVSLKPEAFSDPGAVAAIIRITGGTSG